MDKAVPKLNLNLRDPSPLSNTHQSFYNTPNSDRLHKYKYVNLNSEVLQVTKDNINRVDFGHLLESVDMKCI